MNNYLSLLGRGLTKKEKIYFCWSIGYGEETSPSHPDGMLRKRPLSWSIGYGEETSPSHPNGMLRKRPLFPLEGEANKAELFNY